MKSWPLFLCLLTISACRNELSDTKSTPPNILFIMGDDHTTQAISAYGGFLAKYAQTQHLDQLADEGMRFDQVYCTNAICSPSRATILTGKYSHLNGVRILGQEFDTSQYTIQRALQTSGYQTAVFGKWHLRSTPTGFDDYKVLPVQGRYQDPQFLVKGRDSLVTYPGWATDVITDMTKDFLQKRENGKPFFVMTN